MRKKRALIVAAAIVGALIVGLTAVRAVLEAGLKDLAKTKIEAVDLAAVADGTYPGAYKAFPISVRLEVAVKGHAIAGVRLLEHVNGQGKAAESLVTEAVRLNRIDLDAVAGASYSSKAIMLAMRDALTQAGRQEPAK